MRRRPVHIALSLLLLIVLALAACSSADGSAQVLHIEEGVDQTHAAQTAWAFNHPSATPGPSPTPTETGTPYSIPTNDPGVDPTMVITRVGSQEITLGEFQKRVRFERWRRLYLLTKTVEKRGVKAVLDLTNPDNQQIASLFATLADSNSFGVQVHRLMVIDEIALQEAARRDLDVDTYQFNAKLAEFVGLQVGEGGALPPEFDQAYAEFLRQMTIYSGMTEEELRRLLRALTLYYQEQFLISQSPEAQPSTEQGRIGMEVQDILLDSEEEAQQVVQRLQNGESMRAIAESLGKMPTSGEVTRVLRWSDSNVSQDVKDAVFAAGPNSVVGPIATPQGWYVAWVKGEVFDVLSPQDVQSLRNQYFLDWVEAKMDDTAYVEDYDNWFDYIPQEPLPMDVSPLLRDENVILPEGVESTFDLAPSGTPEPTLPVVD